MADFNEDDIELEDVTEEFDSDILDDEDVTDVDYEFDDEDEEDGEIVESISYAKPKGGKVNTIMRFTKKQIAIGAALAVVVVAIVVTIIVAATGNKNKPVDVTVDNQTIPTRVTEAPTTEEETTTIVEAPPVKEVDISTYQNEDIYSYIYIPNTNIDYPVVQSTTRGENYYVDHTIEHYKSIHGAIFTQFTYNKQDYTDKNTVIYGHNLKNKTMFSQLHKFEDKAFFDANKDVYIYYGDRQFKYQIFAAITYSDVLIPAKYNVTNSTEDLIKFVEEAKTLYGGNVDDSVVIDDKTRIITLLTCTEPSDETKRYLVLAKLVEETIVQR